MMPGSFQLLGIARLVALLMEAITIGATCLGVSAVAGDLHVSPSGDDAHDGAAGRPVASVRRALDLVRDLRTAEPDRAREIVIELADGRYELAEPLMLGPEDAGTFRAPTVIRAAAGARPVISGGRLITDWRVEEEGGATRWVADLPAVRDGRWRFGQLFVNDQRRFRPTVPATGWQTIAAAVPPSPEAEGHGHDRFACGTDAVRADWANLGDVEIVAVHSWAMSRLPIRSIVPDGDDPARASVTLAGRTQSDAAWARLLIGTSGGPHSWGTPSPIDAVGGQVSTITVRDCTIAHGGRLHPAAVGGWIGHAAGCTVEHCDIQDLTYTGISVGWTWGYGESRSHLNRIAKNHIHRLGPGVLSDMGGGYLLGVSPGTVIEGNLIHDIVSHSYGGWGLYTDEGSSGITLRKNLVFRTSSGGFHQHHGRDTVVENNVFAMARDWQLQRTRVEEHKSFRFARNIVWWNSEKPLVQGDWTTGIVTEDNCYWNAAGPVLFPGDKDLTARQQAGQDAGSIVADPAFAAPEAGDFRLTAGSPVWALGFAPLDDRAAGRRTVSAVAELPPVPAPWPEFREVGEQRP